MSQKDILSDLDGLIKRASEISAAGLRKSAAPADPIDGDNGTEAVKHGEQYNKNVEEAGKHTAAKADGGAIANKPGASLEASTEGATAVATDGQSGGEGADLAVKKDADNGPVAQGELSKSAAELIKSARTIAGELKTAAAKLPVDAAAATAQRKMAGILGKSNGQPDAAKPLTGMERFIAKAAMEAVGGGEAGAGAEAFPGGEPEAAKAGADELLQKLQSGEISDEQAEQILMEAAKSGALSEEDMQELAQLAQQTGGGQGGDAGAPPAGDPAAAMPGADAGMAPEAGAPAPGSEAGMPPEAGGDVPPEALQAMKVAALDIGPGHPDYPEKLRKLHKQAHSFGFNLAIKTAQELEAAEDAKGEGESEKHEKGESKAEEHAEHAPGGEEASEVPAGVSSGDPSAAAGIPGDPAAAGIPGGQQAPTGEPAGAGGLGADPLAGLQAKTPEEQAALMQVLQEMGLDPQGLAQLQQAPMPQGLDKTAAFKARARQAIMCKAAAVKSTPTPKA